MTAWKEYYDPIAGFTPRHIPRTKAIYRARFIFRFSAGFSSLVTLGTGSTVIKSGAGRGPRGDFT